MKEKNLAVKLLERLLKERIHQFQHTNVVQSKKFSDLLNMALSNYLKGMLTNEEVIEELLKMAAEIKQNEEESNKLGLSVEEKAFYDALSSPEGIREAYTDEQFVALTKELTEQLRKNRTIDWNRKESQGIGTSQDACFGETSAEKIQVPTRRSGKGSGNGNGTVQQVG